LKSDTDLYQVHVLDVRILEPENTAIGYSIRTFNAVSVRSSSSGICLVNTRCQLLESHLVLLVAVLNG